MIPQGWQPIGEPDVPELSPDALRVKAYITEHGLKKTTPKTIVSIGRALRMGFERAQDAIYEIRKQEAVIIMSRKPKINKEQRTEMLRLHNEERYSVGKLANKFGCSQTAVKTALQAAKIEAEEKAMINTGVNEEFDAAVNEMIAEQDTESELLAADLDDMENGISNTPLLPQSADMDTTEELHEHPAQSTQEAEAPVIPDYVIYAVDCRISELENRLNEFAEQKAALESELRRLQENIGNVQDEHDKLVDWEREANAIYAVPL